MSRRVTFPLQKILRIRVQEEKLRGEALAEKIQEYQLREREKEQIFMKKKGEYAQISQIGVLSSQSLKYSSHHLQALNARHLRIEIEQRKLNEEIAVRQSEHTKARGRVKALENFYDRWYQEQKKEAHKNEQRNIDALAMYVWEQ